jgi:transcriptional regulator
MADRLLDIVSTLTDRHEAGRAQPWKVADAPADYIDGMLKAIVGFAIPIDRLEGKRKLSQNRSDRRHRRGARRTEPPARRSTTRPSPT